MSETSEAARALKRLRERAGLPMREVAEKLGWTLTRYQHYEDRYRRRYLPLELAQQLADIFASRGVPRTDVLALAGVGLEQPDLSAAAQPKPVIIAPPPRDLPVMGTVEGGSGNVYFNEGEAKEYIIRPPALTGVSNAFALYVHGESMEPRYYAGEVLYVNPNRPLTKGCFVAVETTDKMSLIKQFVRRNDDLLVLTQFNPPKEIRIPVAQVKHIYRITGSGESG
jgi:phage repressor protein C with HTH and peptisase S24 domain